MSEANSKGTDATKDLAVSGSSLVLSKILPWMPFRCYIGEAGDSDALRVGEPAIAIDDADMDSPLQLELS